MRSKLLELINDASLRFKEITGKNANVITLTYPTYNILLREIQRVVAGQPSAPSVTEIPTLFGMQVVQIPVAEAATHISLTFKDD